MEWKRLQPGKLFHRLGFQRSRHQPSPTPRDRSGNQAGKPEQGARSLPRWHAPPVLLIAALVVLDLTEALIAGRLGGGLAGGRLLPVADLATTWADYLASWHSVGGGTGAPASPSLLVLALFGSVLGGPSVVVSVLLLFGTALAGLTAYLATGSLPATPLRRAVVAGMYALLPVIASAAGQGRLDVVVAHILVPPLLAGICAVLRGRDGRWLGVCCLTALGLAALGAFAPLLHVVLLAGALLAYAVLPPPQGGRSRPVALAVVVLLSVACLLPWPIVPLRHPQVLLHGIGARVVETPAGAWPLALSPDGSPANVPGVLLVLAAIVAVLTRPSRRMLPGAVLVFAGWALAIVVGSVTAEPITGGIPSTGWPGVPLVLAAAGCCWIMLYAGELPQPSVLLAKLPIPIRIRAVALGLVVIAGFAVAAAVAITGGPLQVRQADTAMPQGTRLVVDSGPQQARLITGMGPRFGDDDLASAGGAASWLRQVGPDLRSADPDQARRALADTAARGAEFLVVPADSRLVELGPDLVTEQSRLPDGRRVLRMLLPSSPVKLVGPDLARQAQTELAPDPQARPLPVDAPLPHFSIRVSEGGAGRALVLGAENEPGWYARIDDKDYPLATAWGHLVAIPLPEAAAEVRVGFTEVPRTTLLALQAAAILFTVVAALPGHRKPAPPGKTANPGKTAKPSATAALRKTAGLGAGLGKRARTSLNKLRQKHRDT